MASNSSLSTTVVRGPLSEPNSIIFSELSVTLSHQEYSNSPFKNVAIFSVNSLECDIVSQTFVNSISIRLGCVQLLKYHKEDTLEVIGTPICARKDGYLFTVNFLQVRMSNFTFKFYKVKLF